MKYLWNFILKHELLSFICCTKARTAEFNILAVFVLCFKWLILYFRLASPITLIPYNYLLQSFKTNTSFTNHAIIKMFHRVAVELKFPEMLFQLSLFITFKDILDSECSNFKVGYFPMVRKVFLFYKNFKLARYFIRTYTIL